MEARNTNKGIFRRLDALQQIANRDKPCHVTVIFADGSRIVTDPLSMWEIYFDHAARENVVNITADCPEYVAAAGIMTILCHPARDRRIFDYE